MLRELDGASVRYFAVSIVSEYARILGLLGLLVVFCDSSTVRVDGNESKDLADDGDVQKRI